MKKSVLLSFFLCAALSAAAHIMGVVLDDAGNPLIGANVYWAESTTGVTTDIEGHFAIEPVATTKQLVTTYIGFHNDTTEVEGKKPLTIVLVSSIELDEVTIAAKKMAVIRSRTSAIDTYTLSGEELCKAACCNLSESFETNASVDVAYADAATGAKQIRLLGLSGTYVQLLSENTPGVRGLAANYGLEYIPGPWMESIQVSKGTSSVINGYEATTGQINVEYLKPQRTNPVAVNLMLNSELHAEANITGGWDLNEHVSTAVLAHYQNGSMPMDENHDSFADMPIGNQANLLNRWYFKQGDYTGQLLVRGLFDQRKGGQVTDKTQENPYLIKLRTYRIDGFMKNGYVFDHDKGTSIGVIAAASYHNQSNQYGLRDWQAAQTNAYLNAIFQTNFTEAHKLTAGLSVNYDRYDETLLPNDTAAVANLTRQEATPGVFAEYSYTYDEHLSLLLGLRGDYSTQYGFFVTPRFNIRYSPWEWWTLRSSVGLGYRSPNILADNAFVMPSSRELYYVDTEGNRSLLSSNTVFHQERALNAGISTTFYIPMGSRELQLSGEYYYTHFFDCVVADMDSDPHAVLFYNSNGARSYAQSWQVEATTEILRGWTMTLAFRQTDVRNTYAGVLREKPLNHRFKGIITTSYQTPLKKWQFDFTAQFNGGGRMPDSFYDYAAGLIAGGSKQYTLAGGDSRESYFTWYPQLMAQVTKYFRTCSLYLGAENMTNFRQDSPIVSAAEPFSQDFDASMAWGPISGWKVYLGFRWALDRKDE